MSEISFGRHEQGEGIIERFKKMASLMLGIYEGKEQTQRFEELQRNRREQDIANHMLLSAIGVVKHRELYTQRLREAIAERIEREAARD